MNSQNNYVHIDFWYGSCEKPFIIEQKNKCNKDIVNIYKCCGKSILMKAYCCDECHINYHASGENEIFIYYCNKTDSFIRK